SLTLPSSSPSLPLAQPARLVHPLLDGHAGQAVGVDRRRVPVRGVSAEVEVAVAADQFDAPEASGCESLVHPADRRACPPHVLASVQGSSSEYGNDSRSTSPHFAAYAFTKRSASRASA